jgi:acetylornithine deacetylase/succinyl-diaminopimelate desuccinylase-like protein
MRYLPLVTALALAAATAAAPATGAAQRVSKAPVYTPGALNADQRLAREIYEELVEINTGVTTGDITKAAVAMAKRFRDAGIPESDVFVGGPQPTKHNVVARIRGKGGPNAPKPILLLAHIDVVEALKADWSPDLDPFTFTERDGYYYGRGTADDKAMAAIFVANAFRLKREGFVPDRDVVIALTADEESGPHNGVDWLLKTHPELVDAALVINEGGGGVLRNGRPLFNGVQATEKVTTNITLRATNRGGHSSVPRDDNAITALAQALVKVGRHRFPAKLNEVTRAFFTKTAEIETPELGRAMRALVANPAPASAGVTPFDSAADVVARDPRYSAMLRTTCVATMLSGGHATNALPQLAEANVNCRVYPSESAEEVRAALERAVGDTAVQVLVRSQRPPSPPSPLAPDVMNAIGQITRDLFGDIPVIPTMSTGATDSRFFRAKGVPAYGVSGLFSDPTVDARAHGRDERMRVQSFYEGQEFLYRLTKALASSKPIP